MSKNREGAIGGIGGAFGGLFGPILGFYLSDFIGLQWGILKIAIVGITSGLIAYLTCKVLERVWK